MKRSLPLMLSFLSLFVVSLLFAGALPAAAQCANGDGGDNNITCSGVNNAGQNIDAGGGNDNVTIEDSTLRDISGGNGNDTITIEDSTVRNVDGGGGNDLIDIDNSDVNRVRGEGGNDTILLNNTNVSGNVEGGNDNNVIIVTGDSSIGGRLTTGNGNNYVYLGGSSTLDDRMDLGNGNDTVYIYGTVNDDGNDAVKTGGGADSLTIGGTIAGGVKTENGDDIVVLEDGAWVGGVIDGGNGNDTLVFKFTVNSQDEYDEFAFLLGGQLESGGTITWGGVTYEWKNFEELVNLLTIAAASGANDVVIRTSSEEQTWPDGRLNWEDAAAPVAVYCVAGEIHIYAINGGNGVFVLGAPMSDLVAGENFGNEFVSIFGGETQITVVAGEYVFVFVPADCPV